MSMTNNIVELDEEDTETKLAILASIFTRATHEELFDILIRADGKVDRAIDLQLDSWRKRSPSPATHENHVSKRPKPQDAEETMTGNDSPVKSLKSVLKWTAAAEPPRKVRLSCPRTDNEGPTSNAPFIPP
jgi:hypothetical protein